MPITDLLRRNAREFGDEVALVELNPEHAEKRRVTWKEYELIQPGKPSTPRQTASPTCCFPAGSARAKRWPSC